MAFSPSDAAIEGFQLARREPRAILAWSLVQLVFGVVVTVIGFPFLGPLAKIESQQAAGTLSTAQIMAAMEPMLGFIGALIPFELAILSLLSAAVYRAVLRPQEKGLGRLRLGGDELRLAILWIELGFLLWAAGLVALLLATFMAAGLSGVLHSSAGGVAGLVLIAYLAVLAVLVWLGVRFSLAGPMTFATRRVHLFSTWKLTRGRLWPLFGSYLLAIIFMLMILAVQLGLTAAVSLLMPGGAAGLMRPDYSSLAGYLTPARIVGLLINAMLGGVFWSVALAPAAVAYREFSAPA